MEFGQDVGKDCQEWERIVLLSALGILELKNPIMDGHWSLRRIHLPFSAEKAWPSLWTGSVRLGVYE